MGLSARPGCDSPKKLTLSHIYIKMYYIWFPTSFQVYAIFGIGMMREAFPSFIHSLAGGDDGRPLLVPLRDQEGEISPGRPHGRCPGEKNRSSGDSERKPVGISWCPVLNFK